MHRIALGALIPHWWRSRFLFRSLIYDQRLVRIVQQHDALFLFQAVTGCDRVVNTLTFDCGAMASSAVSLVSNLRDAAGHHAETRTGVQTNYGDAAGFHEWEFRTRLCTAVKLWLLDEICTNPCWCAGNSTGIRP